MDTPIRRREIDTRHEGIKAMAQALADMGYHRGDNPTLVRTEQCHSATAAMIERLVELEDITFLSEFLTEASDLMISALMRCVAQHMYQCSHATSTDIAALLSTQCRQYGERFLEEALDLLDTRAEVERDRQVDQAIDQQKRDDDER